ncbi:MAG TPA: DUF1835 domain-containing protein [Rhizomicrobium sp.]|jgi:hypothetical protein|nr:DUF1835 domain-containing protein [Rhizomicrobium sp.]
MKRVHLAPGMAARGLVAQACRDHGLGGKVMAVDDDLDIGPLADDATRTSWWAPLRDMYLEGLSTEFSGLDEQWRAIAPELNSANEIVIWSSDAADDQTHLRFAVAQLENYSGQVSLVHVPTSMEMAGVSHFYPDTLAACAAHSVVLAEAKRDELARDYRNRLWGSEGVRYQTDDGLEVRDYAIFDQELLDACPNQFVNPARVIGLGMSRLDCRNWVGDMFLRWRLRHLVKIGLMKATGERWFVDDCDVLVSR